MPQEKKRPKVKPIKIPKSFGIKKVKIKFKKPIIQKPKFVPTAKAIKKAKAKKAAALLKAQKARVKAYRKKRGSTGWQ